MGQVTIKDIAKICGVGVSTVSRAINNHPDINPETKQLIMDTIQEYNYVPNNSAQNLKRVESNTIALLTKGVGNPLFAEMIQTVQSDVLGKDYLFVLQQVDEMENELEVGARLANEKRLKGMIFMGGASRPKEELLARIQVPYVICTVDAVMPENMDHYGIVAIDDEAESYRLIDYLCRMGHKKIAIITAYAHDTSIGKLRLDGYRRALADHGIECADSLVVHMPAKGQVYTMKNGYDQTMKLLQSGEKFTAVYAISDTLAIGACKAIFDYGLKVPDDISVVGCDGLDMARYYQPAITTIEQPLTEMALETSRILFELIREKGGRRKHIFEARIREGQSVRRI
ncbi:MAG: LacI family DNA-binding transcriptional regulator [Lachnospiraceae bacterium]|nr:LacI family DNA-binding transcriptional regulator [Lachnospiraceae bacterium]